MKHSTIKKLVFITPIVYVWALAFLLVLEIGAQLLYQRGKQMSARYSTNWTVRKVCEGFHPDLWRIPWLEYKPNSSAKHSTENTTYAVTINSMGFRGQEVAQTDGSVYVIACIGGSTTVNGSTDSTTYPAFLQEFLNEESPMKVTVINSGIGGLNSSQYGRVIDILLDRVHPNMVVEYNAVNDICWRLFPHWKKQLGLVKRLLLKSQFVKHFFGNHFLPDEHTIRRDIDEFIIENLRSTVATLRQHGVQFSVCSFLYPHPSKMSKDQYAYLDHNLRYWWRGEYISYRKYCDIVDMYNDALKEAFEETDVLWVPLAETGDYPFELFVDTCHMNTHGVRTKARRIAKFLRPRLNQEVEDKALPNKGMERDN